MFTEEVSFESTSRGFNSNGYERERVPSLGNSGLASETSGWFLVPDMRLTGSASRAVCLSSCYLCRCHSQEGKHWDTDGTVVVTCSPPACRLAFLNNNNTDFVLIFHAGILFTNFWLYFRVLEVVDLDNYTLTPWPFLKWHILTTYLKDIRDLSEEENVETIVVDVSQCSHSTFSTQSRVGAGTVTDYDVDFVLEQKLDVVIVVRWLSKAVMLWLCGRVPANTI